MNKNGDAAAVESVVREQDAVSAASMSETPVLEVLLGQPQKETSEAFSFAESGSRKGKSLISGGVVLGVIRSLEVDGRPAVAWPGGPAEGLPSLSLVPITDEDVGRQVALTFPRGDEQPLVMGLVWQPEPGPEVWDVELDGEVVSVEARHSLVLRCGKASISLTADGQILLRGTYISSHSTGTQRIKGAAVRIN